MSALSRRRILFGGAAVGAGALLTACTSNEPENNAQVNTNAGASANPNAAAGKKVIIGFSAPAADQNAPTGQSGHDSSQGGTRPGGSGRRRSALEQLRE
jgi:ribose transport system substrate-binding protein